VKIVIPLAGKSLRFYKKNYQKPKFLLHINGKLVIEHVIDLFSDSDEFFLIISKSQLRNIKKLSLILKKIKKKITIKVINDHNFGPVYSILKADLRFKKLDFLVCYNDLLVEWNYKKFLLNINKRDGAIVSFKGFHPSSFTGTLYCYLKVKNNKIIRISEKKSFTKKPVNEYASAGIYYFGNYENFVFYANKLIESDKSSIKNEWYVSQVYIPMIKNKKKIFNYEVEKFVSLGTPKDYELCKFWNDYFLKYE